MRLYFCSNFLKFTQKLHMSVIFISSKGAYNGNEEVIPSLIKFEHKRLMLEAQNIGKLSKRSFEFFLGMSLYTCRESLSIWKGDRDLGEVSHWTCTVLSRQIHQHHHSPSPTHHRTVRRLGRCREAGILLLPETFKSEHVIIKDRGWKMLVLWYVSTTTIEYCCSCKGIMLLFTVVIYYCIAGLTKLNRSIRFTKGNHKLTTKLMTGGF